jgi:poly[(R)-3-hydroxyalkanoate] polymerase subunit PhaC
VDLLGQQLSARTNPPAFDILYWNADTTRLPAGLHSDFLDLVVSNGLVAGDLTVLGPPVDLGSVSVDACVIAGSTDHIVPWTTAYRTTQLLVLGGDTEFVLSSGGHIQAIVNPTGNPKTSYRTGPGVPPAQPDAWLDGSDKHAGSWWDHWTAWLATRSGDQRPAPAQPGSGAQPPLDPAPGRYLHLR